MSLNCIRPDLSMTFQQGVKYQNWVLEISICVGLIMSLGCVVFTVLAVPKPTPTKNLSLCTASLGPAAGTHHIAIAMLRTDNTLGGIHSKTWHLYQVEIKYWCRVPAVFTLTQSRSHWLFHLHNNLTASHRCHLPLGTREVPIYRPCSCGDVLYYLLWVRYLWQKPEGGA